MTTTAHAPTGTAPDGDFEVDWPLHSCDDHMDLPAIPTDLWTSRMPESDPARVPHVEVVDGRTMWVCDGGVLGLSGPTPSAHTCYERGGIEQDGFRPSNPTLRLQDMDRDGVASSVIYGPSVMGLKIADDALQAAAYRCWNDWAAEFNRVDPDRLCVLARLPSRRPEDATAEIERVAALGHRGAVLDPVEALVGEPEWEPFWAAAEATGLPISYHLGGGSNRAVYQMGNWREPVFATVSPMQLDEAVAETVFSGVLERHPGVRLVLAEAGLGWLPYIIARMDHEWVKHGNIVGKLATPPSELMRRQVWITFEEEHRADVFIAMIGADRVMWACDYPHPDSTWPDSKGTIARDMGMMARADVRKITSTNCRALYDFR
jgi:predicted TIM-barrel fold metal-dependent hydrolase